MGFLANKKLKNVTVFILDVFFAFLLFYHLNVNIIGVIFLSAPINFIIALVLFKKNYEYESLIKASNFLRAAAIIALIADQYYFIKYNLSSLSSISEGAYYIIYGFAFIFLVVIAIFRFLNIINPEYLNAFEYRRKVYRFLVFFIPVFSIALLMMLALTAVKK